MRKKILLWFCLAIIISIVISLFVIYWNRNLRNPEDITSLEYCEDVIRQSYGPDTEQAELFYLKGSAEDIIDFENSFYLYSFDEKPIAIFYQFKPIGYAIYDFRKVYVKECNPEINHPFYVDPEKRYYHDGDCGYYEKTEEGFRNLAVGTLKSAGESISLRFKILKIFVIVAVLIMVILVLRKKRSA